MKTTKQAIVSAIRAFISQRSGIDWRNYGGSREAFMSDYRTVLKHGKQARQLLREVELRESITAEDILSACGGDRLQFITRADGSVACDYCAGQYFVTEYRGAACRLLASVLWSYWRGCMPKGVLHHNSETGETLERHEGLRAGDWLRRNARRELGRGLAHAWFA